MFVLKFSDYFSFKNSRLDWFFAYELDETFISSALSPNSRQFVVKTNKCCEI